MSLVSDEIIESNLSEQGYSQTQIEKLRRVGYMTELILPPSYNKQKYESLVRKTILEGLQVLSNKFNGFEQTTHGHLCSGSLDELLADIKLCYIEPGAYCISNMCQSIDNFVKKEIK